MDGKKETLLLRPLGDANLWKVEKLGSSEVVGYMAVYVDDMMIASKPVTEAVAKMVRGQWSTSEPEYASNASMRFLGMDLEKVKDGYVLQELHPGTSWTAWGGKRVSLCSKSGGVVLGPTNTKKGERGSGPKNMDCMRPIRTMLRLNYVCLTWCSPAFWAPWPICLLQPWMAVFPHFVPPRLDGWERPVGRSFFPLYCAHPSCVSDAERWGHLRVLESDLCPHPTAGAHATAAGVGAPSMLAVKGNPMYM